MKVKIHSIKFDADSKLLGVVQKKLDKLETFFDRIIDGEVFMRVNNEGIKNKTVEIKINIPGDQLFALIQSAYLSWPQALTPVGFARHRSKQRH